MADREDAAVHGMEPSASDAAVDGLRTEAEQQQLPTGDDAVLSGRETRDLELHGAFPSHIDVKAPGAEVRPRNPGPLRGIEAV